MSIQSEMDRIRGNVQSTLTAIADTGVAVPAGANSDDLPAAAQALANEKQDKLTGTAGQIVGFNAQGAAQAQDANFLPAAEGKLILNDVNFNGYNIDGLSTLSVASVQFVPFGQTSPIASIDVSVKGYETAYFEALDLRVSPTPKYIYSATSKNYVDTAIANSLPQETTVTLTAAGWVLGEAAPEPSITPVNQQTVSVPGILKDQTKQTVDVAPADKASRDAWAKANIWCNDPTADGSLTFTADTVPTAAVNVCVRWQGVKT